MSTSSRTARSCSTAASSRISRRGLCAPLVGPIGPAGRPATRWLPGRRRGRISSTARRRSTTTCTRAARHDGVASVPHARTAGHGARSAPRAGDELYLRGERRRGTSRAGNGDHRHRSRQPAAGLHLDAADEPVAALRAQPAGRAGDELLRRRRLDPDPGDTITFSLKSAPAWVTMSGPARIRFEPDLRLVRVPVPVGMDDGDRDARPIRAARAPTRSFIVNLTTDRGHGAQRRRACRSTRRRRRSSAQGLQGVAVGGDATRTQPVGTVLAQDAAGGRHASDARRRPADGVEGPAAGRRCRSSSASSWPPANALLTAAGSPST